MTARHVLMALAFIPAAALAPPAQARTPLAVEVSRQLSLSYVPSCALCHSGGTKGGPADTPFGTSMRARGLSASTDSVGPALSALARDQVDSDGDGIGDVAELLEASDPNHADVGCACSAAAGPRGQHAASTRAALMIVAAFSLSVRAARPRAKRSCRADVA